MPHKSESDERVPAVRLTVEEQARRAARRLSEDPAPGNLPLPFQPTDHYDEIQIDRISPAQDGQVRKDFDEEKLKTLAENLKQVGMQEPIVVRPSPAKDRTYIIVAGERRWRAARMAGLETIPCMVRISLEKAADNLLAQVSENVHREDLNPVEEAEALVQLMAQRGIDVKEAGALMGRTYAQARRLRRIYNAPLLVKAKLRSRDLSPRVAIELLRVYNVYLREDPSDAKERATGRFERLVDKVVEEGWSRKALEAFAKKIGVVAEGNGEDEEPSDRSPVASGMRSPIVEPEEKTPSRGGSGESGESEAAPHLLFVEQGGKVIVFRERFARNGVDPVQRSALIHLLDTMVMEVRRAH